MRKTRKGSVQGVIVAIALCSATAWAADASKTHGVLYEMEVMGVAADPTSGAPIVYLRGLQDKRELSMFIGPFEAQGIALPLERIQPPRPYTHDLMLEAIHRLRGRVKRVIITELRDNTYFANLILEVEGKEVVLDSRPSDAIALALRENAPILAAEGAFVRAPRASRPEGQSP
ncbi:MAG TPA: bifunctional nuclease family protein [archaeon]|nr:bifunctional nuclease family protein [archaeon]